ncbi:MAG: metallophosphoesterase family protein [Bacteroidota bacterium]
MTKIGLLSDTHGHTDERIAEFFRDCHEIWHAGDIGSMEVITALERVAPVRAVYGNIDGGEVRRNYEEHLRFKCEGLDVWITHIGGYPGNYAYHLREKIAADPPGLFISGHSHILKVMNDKKLGLLHMNPGAYGISGLHHVRTALRFAIDGGKTLNLEVLELKRR